MRVEIVGVVNITEDSFSDGGRFLEPERAFEHCKRLAADGAHYVELGPASSHPDAKLVPPEIQIERLRPLLSSLPELGIRVSVDASHPAVQVFALDSVVMLNDVQGFRDDAILERLCSESCRLVVVHSMNREERASRAEFSPREALDSIDNFFGSSLRRMVSAGIHESRVVLDPGLGFFLGSNPACSFRVLRELPDLRKRFGRPLLISASRKSFLQRATRKGVEDVLPATLAAETYAALAGVDYIRTHDVGALRDALIVLRRTLDARQEGVDES